MAKYAMIDINTNQVGNIIEWDGNTQYTVHDDCILIQSDVAGIGDMYNPDTQEFIRPDIVPVQIPELTPQEKLARAGLTVEELKSLLGL